MTPAMQTSAFAAKVDCLTKAATLEMEFGTDRQLANYRSYLYGINKDGIRKFRTIREGNVLVVWRIK